MLMAWLEVRLLVEGAVRVEPGGFRQISAQRSNHRVRDIADVEPGYGIAFRNGEELPLHHPTDCLERQHAAKLSFAWVNTPFALGPAEHTQHRADEHVGTKASVPRSPPANALTSPARRHLTRRPALSLPERRCLIREAVLRLGGMTAPAEARAALAWVSRAWAERYMSEGIARPLGLVPPAW